MRAALLLLGVLPFAAMAETAYVTDTVQLGLHQAADTSDRAFRRLESGQELEIIARDGNFANVRLPDGAQGYVKATFLVIEKPAKLIVAELQTAYEGLQQELESTKAAFATPAATIASLEQQVAEYRLLKDGKVVHSECNDLADLPRILISARIAKGLSQKDLGNELGMTQQQVQRYEATDYMSASLSHLIEDRR